MAHATRDNALKWLERTKFSFPLLVDENASLYRQLGMRRRLTGLLTSTGLLKPYVEPKVAGVQLPLPDRGDDTLDMGGDFIVDGKGELLYCFCQTHVFRRPLKEVMDVLQQSQ